MRKNWPFILGMALFVGQAPVFMSGSPLLGLVSISCIGCLLVGLFRYAVSDVSVGRLAGYTVGTAVLILMAGRALFAVVESMTYDTSADVYVEHVINTGWILTGAAFIYGILYRNRRRRLA